jgi:FKBP-type peptidyl-prolyl cis-trans isomerase
LKQLFAVLIVALIASACGGDSGGGNPNDPSQVVIQFSTVDLATGTGPQAASGNTVNTRYTLWLYNPSGPDQKGSQLQTGPFGFILGRGQSIPGFEQGVVGMQVGGKRRIYVPSSLGYGSQGSPQGGIPPNAALVFEVELLDLQ